MKKLFTFIVIEIKKFAGSFDNVTKNAHSARKLTSLFAVLVGAYVTKYKLPPTDQLAALYAWLGLALLCLGIVTVQNIIDFKNGKSNGSTTTEQPTI